MPIKTAVTLPALHQYTGMDLSTALAERATTLRDKPFVIWEPATPGGSRTWTYGEFARDVESIAAGLWGRGTRDGDAVMLVLDNSPALLLSLFACARIGAVAVNTNARYATAELEHAVALTAPVGVITHERLVPRLGAGAQRAEWIVPIDESSGTPTALYDTVTVVAPRQADPGAALCIQFTSGTTSRPKAALYTHANALWAGQVGAANQALRPDDIALVFAPLFHTGALSWQFLSTFWAGGTVVVVPKFSASRFWEVSTTHGCTTTFTVSVMRPALELQDVPPHRYRLWVCGVEAPDVERRYGIRTFAGWGMTETVSQAIVNHPLLHSEPGTIGRLCPGYEAKVVGPDGDQVPLGEEGELCVRGPRGVALFAEYYGDSDSTDAAFDSEGYFRTGDRVALSSSGTVRFVARLGDLLKVGGENVAAAEVERVVMGVPRVRQTAVVGRPDRYRGEVPIAFVVIDPNADEAGVREEVMARCTEELADFKVPRAVHILDELPLVGIGKIAKGRLRKLAAALADERDLG